jgi:hypothetical protein
MGLEETSPLRRISTRWRRTSDYLVARHRNLMRDLHTWKILSIYWSDGPETSSAVQLSRKTSHNRSCSSNNTQQPKNTRLWPVTLLNGSQAYRGYYGELKEDIRIVVGTNLKCLVNAETAAATNSQTPFGNSQLSQLYIRLATYPLTMVNNDAIFGILLAVRCGRSCKGVSN